MQTIVHYIYTMVINRLAVRMQTMIDNIHCDHIQVGCSYVDYSTLSTQWSGICRSFVCRPQFSSLYRYALQCTFPLFYFNRRGHHNTTALVTMVTRYILHHLTRSSTSNNSHHLLYPFSSIFIHYLTKTVYFRFGLSLFLDYSTNHR